MGTDFLVPLIPVQTQIRDLEDRKENLELQIKGKKRELAELESTVKDIGQVIAELHEQK
jgi:uncharacterized protein YoxC